MQHIKDIIKKIEAGEIPEDERGAGGFWDLAGEIVLEWSSGNEEADDALQELIYQHLTRDN